MVMVYPNLYFVLYRLIELLSIVSSTIAEAALRFLASIFAREGRPISEFLTLNTQVPASKILVLEVHGLLNV